MMASGQYRKAKLILEKICYVAPESSSKRRWELRPTATIGSISDGSSKKGGKTVYAWAFEGDLPDSFQCRSNMFEMEWPPRSGKMQNFLEVDEACFFSLEDARRKLKEAQTPFLDRLQAALTNGR